MKTKEAWKQVPTFSNYEVSSFGSVRRLTNSNRAKRGYVLTGSPRAGYLLVKLAGSTGVRTRSVHSIVAEAFLGPCPTGLQINHKDGCKTNNTLVNLEYVTASQNRNHALDTGLAKMSTGETHPRAILNYSKAYLIRNIYPVVKSQRRLAGMFGVGQVTIWRVLNNKLWVR